MLCAPRTIRVVAAASVRPSPGRAGEFRGRTLDFVVMLAFGAGCMLAMAPLLSVHFLGSSLAFMMVYVWGRRTDPRGNRPLHGSRRRG